MDIQTKSPRQARLQRECDVDIGPVLLLAVASAFLIVFLGLDVVGDDWSAALQAALPAQNAASTAR